MISAFDGLQQLFGEECDSEGCRNDKKQESEEDRK